MSQAAEYLEFGCSQTILAAAIAIGFPFHDAQRCGRAPRHTGKATWLLHSAADLAPATCRVVTSRKFSSGKVICIAIPVRDTFTYAVGSKTTAWGEGGRLRAKRPRS